MENPLVALRRQRGLSRPELARALGLPYLTIAAHELGYPACPGKRLLDALRRSGLCDPRAFERAYRAWRASGLRREARRAR